MLEPSGTMCKSLEEVCWIWQMVCNILYCRRSHVNIAGFDSMPLNSDSWFGAVCFWLEETVMDCRSHHIDEDWGILKISSSPFRISQNAGTSLLRYIHTSRQTPLSKCLAKSQPPLLSNLLSRPQLGNLRFYDCYVFGTRLSSYFLMTQEARGYLKQTMCQRAIFSLCIMSNAPFCWVFVRKFLRWSFRVANLFYLQVPTQFQYTFICSIWLRYKDIRRAYIVWPCLNLTRGSKSSLLLVLLTPGFFLQ